MNASITQAQAEWAASHDWFLSYADGAVIVRDELLDFANKQVVVARLSFRNFAALRAWAGY